MRMAKDPVQLQTIIEEVMLLSQQSCGERGSGNPASLGMEELEGGCVELAACITM